MWIEREGFCILHVGIGTAMHIHIQRSRKHWRFQTVSTPPTSSSRRDAAFASIFQFHSITVMNFVSADRIFCTYPHLTFSYFSIVNPGTMSYDAFDVLNVHGLRKYYEVQSFTYFPWPTSKVGEVPDIPYRFGGGRPSRRGYCLVLWASITLLIS